MGWEDGSLYYSIDRIPDLWVLGSQRMCRCLKVQLIFGTCTEFEIVQSYSSPWSYSTYKLKQNINQHEIIFGTILLDSHHQTSARNRHILVS